MTGPLGKIYRLRRANRRCPAKDFLEDCEKKMFNKFKGSFRALTIMGAEYVNDIRFKPLRGKGKPLWEFKEHDHRLYSVRTVDGSRVAIVLLNGWSKDKDGISREESIHIDKALTLYQEYQEYLNERRQP